MLGGVRVEHELGKRTVQPGDAALQQRETRAGNLGGGGEIELAERLADIGVVLDREIESARRTPALDLDVGGFITADRHRFVGNIGQPGEDGVEFFQQFAEAGFGSLQLVAQRADLRHDLGGILALPLQHADLL